MPAPDHGAPTGPVDPEVRRMAVDLLSALSPDQVARLAELARAGKLEELLRRAFARSAARYAAAAMTADLFRRELTPAMSALTRSVAPRSAAGHHEVFNVRFGLSARSSGARRPVPA